MTTTTVAVWSIEETSRQIGVPVQTLYYWRRVRTGPPAHKAGRRLHYLSDEVIAWLREQ